MKEYPSISKLQKQFLGNYCTSFYKYDGSNLRTEWTKKRGWYKWGTRRRLFDAKDEEYGEAIAIFEKDYAEPLTKAIVDNFKKCDQAIVFFEFFGPNTFAGWHDPSRLKVENNDPKEIVIFDVNIHKKGMVGPENFVKYFGHLKIPPVIYTGPLTEEFIQDVRMSNYPVNEGVVCKGGDGFDHSLWMCKIKTWKYLRKLKEKFGQKYLDYWE